MNYDQEILRILAQAGSNGLKLENIARHVFNSCNSMFNPLNYKDVYNYVRQYLKKYSKDSQSLVEKSDKHGIYHLNLKSKLAQQYALQFTMKTDEAEAQQDASKASDDELSLSLF